jgi:hypothetical protein
LGRKNEAFSKVSAHFELLLSPELLKRSYLATDEAPAPYHLKKWISFRF